MSDHAIDSLKKISVRYREKAPFPISPFEGAFSRKPDRPRLMIIGPGVTNWEKDWPAGDVGQKSSRYVHRQLKSSDNRANFWSFAALLVQEIHKSWDLDISLEDRWFANQLYWTNLTRVSGEAGLPTGQLYCDQINICIELLKAEISDFEPDLVVIPTGSYGHEIIEGVFGSRSWQELLGTEVEGRWCTHQSKRLICQIDDLEGLSIFDLPDPAQAIVKELVHSADWNHSLAAIEHQRPLHTTAESGQSLPPASTINRHRDYSRSCIRFGEASKSAMLDIDYAFHINDEGNSSTTTGIFSLDECIQAIQPSELTIISGLPGTGKTALALQTATQVAKNYEKDEASSNARIHGRTVGFFSLGQSSKELAAEILCQQSHLERAKLKMGLQNSEEYQQLISTVVDTSELPLLIDDTPNLSIESLSIAIKQMVEIDSAAFIVIDHLQLLQTAQNGHTFNQDEEIPQAANSLKQLAEELNIAIVALFQEDPDRTFSQNETNDLTGDTFITLQQISNGDDHIDKAEMAKTQPITQAVIKKPRLGAQFTAPLLFDEGIRTFCSANSEQIVSD